MLAVFKEEVRRERAGCARGGAVVAVCKVVVGKEWVVWQGVPRLPPLVRERIAE